MLRVYASCDLPQAKLEARRQRRLQEARRRGEEAEAHKLMNEQARQMKTATAIRETDDMFKVCRSIQKVMYFNSVF